MFTGTTIMGATMLPETVRYGVPFGTGNRWPKMYGGFRRSPCSIFQNHRYCQGIDSFYELLAITELPNNELTGIHTRDLPPLLL